MHSRRGSAVKIASGLGSLPCMHGETHKVHHASQRTRGVHDRRRCVDCWMGSGAPSERMWHHLLRVRDMENRTKHWKSNRLEVEAIVKGLTKFRPYTLGQKFANFSDNSAVCSIANTDHTSDFVKRRLDIILEHNPETRFVPDKSNIWPDFLSGLPELFGSQHDQVLSAISKSAAEMSDDELLKWGHRGHFSVQETQKRIRKIGDYVQWKKIRQYVKDCRACQQFTRPKLAAPRRMEGVNDVRDVVSCDSIGPFERGPGNVRYIFAIVDHLSRFGVARKCCLSNTARAARCL